MFNKIKYLGLFLVFAVIIIFGRQFFFQGKIPFPADTIVGLYHPFRDEVWDGLTAGVPFKNFLITDAVRQQYPWRELAIDLFKERKLPLWNPYEFSGTPLLANLQSAVLNPFNSLFFILPFAWVWGLQVLLQLFLSAIFLYLFLKNFRLKEEAIILACLSWIFGGFFVAWFEWNTILQAGLWLPLILLAKEKIIFFFRENKYRFSSLRSWQIYKWILLLVIAENCTLFAGHLQTFFYVVVFSSIYLIARFFSITRKKKELQSLFLLFLLTGTLSFLVMSVQLFPTLEFIFNSGRSFDQPLGFRLDWYLPWKHLTQLVVPDFFGNPTTLNYWGEWNYGEFVSYAGIIPLFFALLAIFYRRDKKTYFFAAGFLISLLFALPNPISFLPYVLNISFISTTAPSRLLYVTGFCLSILAALGVDCFLKEKKQKNIFLTSLLLILPFSFLWLLVIKPEIFHISPDLIKNLAITKRNLILPSLLMISTPILLVFGQKIKQEKAVIFLLILITAFDLLRFSQKFNPFVKQDWIFPQTESLHFLQEQKKPFRIAATDSRIFPPNFSVHYRLESIEGYDPLYNLNYGEFWAAVKRGRPDISSFNFNRIVTPQLVNSPFADLLGVKYLLSFDEYQLANLKKVFTQGQTKIYENSKAFPRAFMVGRVIEVKSKKEAIDKLFANKNNLKEVAIIEEHLAVPFQKSAGYQSEVNIGQYSEQSITVNTRSNNPGFLVVGNMYYPGWQARIDGVKTKIVKTNYLLQGLLVPAGEHEIVISFLPAVFLLGLATSTLGITILLLWGAMVWKRK